MKIKRKISNSNGITLIALVITIIVLLILAGVTIATLTGPNGLLTRANEAKEETAKAGAKEKVQLEVAASYDNNGNFNMDKLKENLKNNLGLTDSDIMDNEDGSITVTVDGYEVTVDVNGMVTVEGEATTPEEPNPPEKTVIEDLEVGDKVYYDTGNTNIGNEGLIECTVLYDKTYNEEKGTNYGVQIISTDVIKTIDGTAEQIELGPDDPTVTEGITDFEKARNSYNNALKLLYDKAQEYLNTTYASGARCVGSDPADPDWDTTTTNEAGYYTKEIAQTQNEYQSYMESYYGTFKNEDENYNIDCTQMEKVTGLKLTSFYYWLASRGIESNSSDTLIRSA